MHTPLVFFALVFVLVLIRLPLTVCILPHFLSSFLFFSLCRGAQLTEDQQRFRSNNLGQHKNTYDLHGLSARGAMLEVSRLVQTEAGT